MSLPAGPGAPPASIAPWPLTARGAPAFDRCHALVIDGNPASRSVLAAMLRDVGVGTVVQSSRAQDARRLIEYRHFHIVVCEYHFESQPMTGQDLMDDLRLAQVMPLSTVVVMISSEAAYTRVAEAAEAALDAYLIKPHTEAALRERIHQAMQRKLALRDIIDLVEAGRYDQAIAQCQARCDARTPNWLNAARIGAELCLRQGRMGPAMGLLEAILSTQALPWARLGYARTEYQAGGMQQARRTLESLLNDQPGYADAYDVMGRVLLDQGEPEAALHAMRRACGLTPGSVARLQKLGLLAFYHGEPAEAARVLQRAAALGLNSKVFDLQALVLLGTLQYDQGDHRGLGQSLRSISAARAEQPQSARLRRFEQVLGVLHQLQQRRVAEAMAGTRHAVGEAQEADFEFEAACNLLSMLARLLSRELWPEAVDEWVGALADRFTVSRTTCELMCRACSAVPALVALIQARYAAVCEQAERAVEHTVSGHPRTAVLELLAGAERSFNAKLIDLALHTLARHRHTISQADELEQRARALDRRYRSYGTQVQLRGRPAPGAACGLAAEADIAPWSRRWRENAKESRPGDAKGVSVCDLYLVDDHALVREGLRAIVERGGHTVVGESAQFTEALAEIAARLPQVVLLDLDLGERSGLELLDEVRKRALPVRVLVISMSCRPGDVAAALRAGASGYVLKGSSGAVLLQAIDAAVRGQCFLAPAEADLALQGLAPQDTTALALSARERQILQLAAAGRSSAAIGSLLNLSPKTVESYRHRGMRKLGLADTPALVRWAIREGLMALDAP